MKHAHSAPHFTNDVEARKVLEAVLWPDGPVCAHCGVINKAYATKRAGVYRCASKECRKDFSVTMKTVMERSHIALHKWLYAFHLMTSSKKGISAHQLHRTLGVTYRSAWFMAHRIREAMRAGGLGAPVPPMGGNGGIVEADETFVMRKKGYPKVRGGSAHKHAILSLVERGGSVRSVPLERVTNIEVTKIVRENVHQEARLMTDTASYYRHGVGIAKHETVNHTIKEYVRGDVHTNTVEGYFSIFKRGMRGVYQHCAEKHLHRYLAEYDFRYNHRIALGVDDAKRATQLLLGTAGKRLTYRRTAGLATA